MNETNDNKLRILLSGTRIEANENLKHRIMQQILTESAISRSKAVKKEQSIKSKIKNLLTILGVMYALLALTAVVFYLYMGKEFLYSSQFLIAISFIVIISSAFGFINHIDQKLRQKLNSHKQLNV